MIRRVAAGIGMTAFDKLVIAATQLALVPILAAHWGLALYGQWLILATVPQFLSMSDFGFATVAGTRMTMAVARGEPREAVRIFQSAWRAVLASAAVLIVALTGIVWFLPDGVFGARPSAAVFDLRLTLSILVIYGVMAVQGSIFFAGFRCAQQFSVGAFWNAMTMLIENAALVLTVWCGGGIVAAAMAWLLGRMFALAIQNLLLRRRVPWLEIGVRRGSWDEAWALLRPAGAVMLMPLAQALVLQGTALMIGAAAGQVAVPVFAATRTLSRVGMQLCWVVSTPLMPEFSAAIARRDRGGMAAMVLATLLFSALLVVPYGLAFMGWGQTAIALWTHGAITPPPMLVLAMGATIVFGGVWYPLSNLLLASDRQAAYTGWYVALALASLPITYGLARLIGVSAGGLAMVVLDLAMLIVVGRLVSRHLATGNDLRRAVSTLNAVTKSKLRNNRKIRAPFVSSEVETL